MRKELTDKPLQVAVVLCTYNWPSALRLCINSLMMQTRKPDEIIIADDGSTTETSKTINEFRSILPIKHVWQKDEGFRRAMILNKAFSICKSDYIIQVDGDIIMGRHFVEDHLSEARPHTFLVGSRGKICKKESQRMITNGMTAPKFWTRGIARRQNVMRIPFLTRFFYNYKQNRKERGCNMSFWRKDVYNVNGYDNGMVGYGSEDVDFAARLKRSGIKKRFIKFKAVEFHLYHKKVVCNKELDTPNHNRMIYHNQHNVIRVEDGIARFRIHSEII